MPRKWYSHLADVNKELLLILSITASAAAVNCFISGQRLVLTFYNLPTLFAVYHFGRRRAVETALASILLVVWINVMNPAILGFDGTRTAILSWSDLMIWGCFLLIFAYACGTMYERSQQNIVVKGSGADFDPDVVEAFEALFRRQRLEIGEVVV